VNAPSTLQVTLPPELRLRLRLPLAPVGRLAWSRRGDRLLVSAVDHALPAPALGGAPVPDTLVVDAVRGDVVERWPGYWYRAMGCAAEDGWVAAGNDLGGIDRWRFGQARPEPGPARHQGRIEALVFAADGRRLYSAGADGRVGCWDTSSWEARFWDVGGRPLDLAHDGAGDALVVATGRTGALVLDGQSGRPRGSVRAPGRVTTVAFANDGALLLAGTRAGQLVRYDAARLAPLGPSAQLGIGPIGRLAALGGLLVAEGGDGVAVLAAESGRVLAQWRNGATLPGGTLAVDTAQRAFAVALPAGLAIVEVLLPDPEPPEDVVATYHPNDAPAVAVVLAHLRAAGAGISDGAHDSRALVAAARRGATAVMFYGPSGPAPRHDYQVDVLRTHKVRTVPVILPGGFVPEGQRAFHLATYVCFHGVLHDGDSLDRVARAVLPQRRRQRWQQPF